jgi:hypothetical protein
MVVVIVTVKKSVLLLSNAEVCSIFVGLPTSEGAIEFQVLPIDRKNSFAFKLFTEDRKMAWCVNTTGTTMILWAVLVTMPRGTTVTTDKVVVGVGSYDGDTECSGGHWGCRTFTITVGKVGRGRSGGTCDSSSTGISGRASTMHSSKGVCWFVKWRSCFLQYLQCSHRRKRHST